MSDHRQEKRLTRTEESREEEGRQQPEALESFKGYRLCDPLGRKIGCVEKLFDNGEDNYNETYGSLPGVAVLMLYVY